MTPSPARPRARRAFALAAFFAALATLTFAASYASAQDEPPAPTGEGEPPAAAPVPPAPPDCSGEEYKRFDFWVGEWTVYPWSGREVENPPTSRIEKILDGCAVREQFSSPGYAGTSITFYDRYDQRWHQTWMASDGDPLYLVGGWAEGKMVLSDDPQDGRPKSRITWEPLAGGGLRQTWELTRDGGETWQKVFDGKYVAAGAAPGVAAGGGS